MSGRGVTPDRLRCWAHFTTKDGEVGHCAGPLDHWGDHADEWPQPESVAGAPDMTQVADG